VTPNQGATLVFEGEAHRETDPATLGAGAADHRQGGWPAQVDGGALTAADSVQSAGPAPWQLYRLRMRTVFGLGLRAPYGASRWDF